MKTNGIYSGNWQDYQKRLKKIQKKRSLIKRLPLLGTITGIGFLVFVSVFFAGSWLFANLEADRQDIVEDIHDSVKSSSFNKTELPDLLREMKFGVSPANGSYIFSRDGAGFIAETSIEPSLQNYIIRLLKRSRTNAAAVVAMRPYDGQILAMVNSSGKGGMDAKDLCLKADLPAASLFKIVSAAAAIEARHFTPGRTMQYRGGKYTLYKSQLKQDKGRNLRKASFKEAFSESINPVFGKIGIYDLGKDLIAQYAEKFYFNHDIPFDLPLERSNIEVPEDDFGLAEIASGFNKRTRLSPLHAVMITSAVANQGIMMEPWLIRDIRDETGRILYSARPSRLTNPIRPETAESLKILMEETVTNGTCRRTFRSLRRKKAFRDIELGAKTGTINDRSDRYKYDWLTAFALPEGNESDQGICLVVMAVHGAKLGIRAKNIARDILNYHFTS